MKKVAIVSTGHPPFDERIFNKIGMSLTKSGYDVSVIVTTEKIDRKISSINFKGIDSSGFGRFREKFKFIIRELKNFNPDVIINCEPIPVLISYFFTLLQRNIKPAKIIYDVTEWYPENIFLKRKGLKRILLFIGGHIINFLATNFSDYLFIGEETKVNRYRKYSPKKKFSIISYYPILDYYNQSTRKVENKEIFFGYAGVISVSRGLEIFYRLISELNKKLPDYKFGFILAGRFESPADKIYLQKFESLGIKFNYYDWTSYENFSRYLEPVHICLDVRPPNKIYERSLPIKIFDYMALGKCIIASNYEPIRKIFEIANCGVLVNPVDLNDIVSKTIELINNPEKIFNYGLNARLASETFFNWKICEEELLRVLREEL
jgi:glycosyltransferase involved in cell wall biosynthesis